MCNGTVHHGKIDYTVVDINDCLALVERITAEGHDWHNHVLSPGCDFNPYEGSYALVVEDDTLGKAYIARSEGFPEVDKLLVKRLHGDDILSAAPADSKAGVVEASALLTRLVELDGRRIKWHHHMNFPNCALNPHKGQWAITIESAEGTFSEAYADEPRDGLRVIEGLYFANLAEMQAKAKGE
jgi:hypothetical protein